MRKFKINAHLDFTEDELLFDDNLTDEEIEKEIQEYIFSFFDWGYEEVQDE